MPAARTARRKAVPPKAASVALPDPTPEERKAIAQATEARAVRPARTSVVLKNRLAEGGGLAISNPHSDGLGWDDQMKDAFGTTSDAFANQAFMRLANAFGSQINPPTEGALNGALALLGAIDPQNELEAAIGEQIISAHVTSLDLLSRARLNAGQHVDAAAAYANMATKVSRTMALHVETLTKLRSGGKQTHEVRYIYINGNAVVGDGAQAVFGDAEVGGGGGDERKRGQPHGQPALAHIPGALVPPMRREDPCGDAVSGPGNSGAEALQEPWRPEPRSAHGKGERALSDRAMDKGVEGSPRARSRRAGVGGV